MHETEQGRHRRRGRVLAVIGALGIVVGAVPPALAESPASTGSLDSDSAVVAGGEGNQTDPHLSGSLVAYTDSGSANSEIRYVDLAGGTSGVVPNAGHRDSLPDVDGDLIVFRRVFTDGSSARRPILLFDVSAPELGVRELAPDPVARRGSAVIGGTTVAFVQQSGPSSQQSEICVADLTAPEAAAVCLTSDGLNNRTPALSPDGSALVFTKCATTGLGCDIYASRRAVDGTWATPWQLTGAAGEEFQPVTDGAVVAYVSNVAGDYDIWWQELDGSAPSRLELGDVPGSTELNPDLSAGVLTFERELPGQTAADLWLYRLQTRQLYRLTDTPDDETLHATSVQPDGELHVAWAQPDGRELGNNDIHALRAQLPSTSGPAYAACPLYDTTRAHRLGSTVPLQVQLCDADGANLSSPDLTVTATGLIKLDGSATTVLAEDSGNANPDDAFRYDPELAGYIYNLSTKGLTSGTWALQFTVAGSPTIHRLTFDVR